MSTTSGDEGGPVFERMCLLLLAVIITILTLVSVAGHGPFAGRVLISLSRTHGIDQGDIPMAGLWLIAMVLLALLWRRTPRG